MEPRIAMLSFSNFGSVDHPHTCKIQKAVEIALERQPDLMIDGEMQGDSAVVPDILKERILPIGIEFMERDIINEEAARVVLEPKWRCRILKLQPALYHVDWAMFRMARSSNAHPEAKDAELAGWAEYKRRKGDSTQYQLWKVSLAKWLHLKRLAESTRVPSLLVIEWDDGIFYGSWEPVSGKTYPHTTMINNSREDGVQEGDLEPAIAIPRTEFKKL